MAERQLVRADALGPLAGELAAASGTAVRLELVPMRALLDVRGPATEAFAAAVAEVFGVALPFEPNRWAAARDRAAAWTGPDEWLLVAPDGESGAIEHALRQRLADQPWFSIVDVSHNYTSLRLSGPRHRELLAKGCALDLHPESFGTGACVQTLLARTRVILRAVDGDAIELWLRNSFAAYAAQWLLDASLEFRQAQGES